MRSTCLFLFLITIFAYTTFAQEQTIETGIRDAFLVSREKKVVATNKQTSQPTKNGSGNTKTTGHTKLSIPKDDVSILGLGYTIYMRTNNDECVSVDPTRRFRSGDSIRITFEPNIDCFIYIFYVENNGEPELLFPDRKLNYGNNKALSHVPFEIPSSENPNPDLCWFNFSGAASNQQLYVVATRKPISEVPTGKSLELYSQEHRKAWKPSKVLWSELKRKADEPITLSKSNSYGQSQPKIEKVSIGRRLSLSSNAPSPSIIQVSNSPVSDLLVARIELIQD
ncbi:MAG: DUF4384 domain-containing protein [Acidobacteria bacterium]|nr:DUF4384 domain-containing protein [Acidobacteriota bacterium]